jgi:hypothetical protein
MIGRQFSPRPLGVELDADTRTLIAHLARLDPSSERRHVLQRLALRIGPWTVVGWAGPYWGCHCGCESPRELVCIFAAPGTTAGMYMPTELDALLADQT